MSDAPYSFADWQSGLFPTKKGWDCADAIADGWTAADLLAFMRATVRPWTPAAKSTEKPAERDPAPAGPVTPISTGKPVREARTTQQEQPEQATVTHIQTRKTVKADDSWQMQLVCGEEGKTKPGVTKNWALFLENHPATRGVFAFDAFKLRVMLMRCPPWEDAGASWTPRALQDRDYSEAVMWLEAMYMTPKASSIAPVIHTVAERSSFDRLREYLETLEWDRKPRLADWLTYYLGADDTPYTRAVGSRWLISAVARGLEPGCKVDTMPILEGPQGLKKSTAMETLYSKEFFSDELSDVGSKDAKMELQGVWGLEVGEMHKFSAAATNAVKLFLTQKTDRFRPPYGRSIIETPRRVVLNGTINPEGNAYLKDTTGGRRFWPIEVKSIDIDGLAADRNQLWAEAVTLFKAGTPWWVQDDEQTAVEAEQEKRTDVDVWVDLIVPIIKGQGSIAQVDIFKELGIPNRDADTRVAGRVGRIMKKLGWSVGRDRSGGDDRVTFYNPNATDAEKADW